MPRWMRVWVMILLVSTSPAIVVRAATGDDCPRIGVYDPQILWETTNVGKKYNGDLTAAKNRLQEGVDKKVQELKAFQDKLAREQASLDDDKMQQMQKDLLAKRTELERASEDAKKEIRFQLTDLQAKFEQMVEDTVETYGKEKGLTMILSKTLALYSAASVDITQEILARFNVLHPVAAAVTPAAPAPKKPADKPKAPGKP